MNSFLFQTTDKIPTVMTMTKVYNKTKNDLYEVQKVLRYMNCSENPGTSLDECGWHTYPKGNIHNKIKVSCEDEYKNNQDREKLDSTTVSEDGSDDSECTSEVAVKSVLIPSVGYSKNRKVFTCLQNTKVETRNRRMLGMLQGTLKKFIDEAERKQHEISRRTDIEKKIERAVKEEREGTLREKLKEKEVKQMQLRCLKEMIIILQQHEMWKRKQKNNIYFILTRSKPHIYFLPSKHSKETMMLLIKSKNKVLRSLERQEQALLTELENVKRSYSSRCSFSIKEFNSSPEKFDYVAKSSLSSSVTPELLNYVPNALCSDNY